MSIINKNKIKKISINSVLLAMGLIFSYIDYLLPIKFLSFGIKIGLSNIIIILSIFLVGKKSAFLIGLLKVIIMSIFFGNFIYFCLSLFPFLTSFITMCIIYDNFLLKYKNDKIIFIMSIPAAILHNLTQVFIIAIITKNHYLFRVIPLFIIEGAVSGCVIAGVTVFIFRFLCKSLKSKQFI